MSRIIQMRRGQSGKNTQTLYWDSQKPSLQSTISNSLFIWRRRRLRDYQSRKASFRPTVSS
ncbi:MAG TPA: hypothetical protein VFH91_10830, partial [Pyrinomonadaceae bacterium]|nr:hypothetical protein [Pyrinomonadaceae bacterium]